jgi:hypothetical protein
METTVELHDTSERAAQATHRNPKLLTFQRRDGPKKSREAASVLQGARSRSDPPRIAHTSTLHISNRLAQQIQRITAQLKADYASELQQRVPAAEAGKLFALLLRKRQKPGRPRSKEITAAIELKSKGLRLAEIARRVIPDFGTMHPGEQSFRREQLRRAMYMRSRGRHKLKKVL